MESIKEKYLSFKYKGILGVALIFALISLVLFVERSGISYNYAEQSLPFLPQENIVTAAEAAKNLTKDTIVIYDSESKQCREAYEQYRVILRDMKIGYKLADTASGDSYSFNKYENAIILLHNLSAMGDSIIALSDWVENGGNALFAMVIEKEAYSSVIENKLGITDSSYNNAMVESIHISKDFMIGGGRSFAIPDGYDSARALQLTDDKTTVYAYTADSRKLPLVWEADCGKGKFVVNNIGLYTKAMRGFCAATISLLGNVSVYPVINGSTFYLDDFPSQIPQGNSTYITRDYGTNIRDFYVNIWWPDMMNFSDRYGIKYTGLAIECYDDNVDGTTPSEADTGTFLNFGNMLLRHGGEIGYHGYNHQPLCLSNCDYRGIYDYKTWESYSAMKGAFDELVDFCDSLFTGVDMQVYVPPSNLLSKEGRAFLLKEYPHINTISGIYFEDDDLDFSCTQEYEVTKDGVVDQPRIISGCALTDFMKLAAVSELNFHYINNHFTHPDDALDPDRGAEMGWKKLKESFDGYLDWLYTSAPGLRNFTGSEMSAAVQRYAAIGISKEIKKDKIILNLDNFHDEAQLMIRFNEGSPTDIKGGTLTHITGNLYLISANKDTVTVSVK